MSSSVEILAQELPALAAADSHCRECLAEVERRTPEFPRIRDRLTEEDQEALDLYIAACEEHQYSFVYPAYELGKRHRYILVK